MKPWLGSDLTRPFLLCNVFVCLLLCGVYDVCGCFGTMRSPTRSLSSRKHACLSISRDVPLSLRDFRQAPSAYMLTWIVQSHQTSSLAQDTLPRFRTWSLHIRSPPRQYAVLRITHFPSFSEFIYRSRARCFPSSASASETPRAATPWGGPARRPWCWLARAWRRCSAARPKRSCSSRAGRRPTTTRFSLR